MKLTICCINSKYVHSCPWYLAAAMERCAFAKHGWWKARSISR
ncbi:MAG: hypothetical protein ACLT0Y_03840 [Christensenellales bacterium]